MNKTIKRFFPALSFLCTICFSYANEPIQINEIRIDQTGDDVSEYVELVGPPGKILSGIFYLVIGDGELENSGCIEVVIDLSNDSIGSSGFFLIAESNPIPLLNSIPNKTTKLNFENDDNVTHLLVKNFTSSLSSDLDIDDDGNLDILPWDYIIDKISLIKSVKDGNRFYSETTIGPMKSSPPAHVFRESSLGVWRMGTMALSDIFDTPGRENYSEPVPLFLTINAIRSNSPIRGTTVFIRGVVSNAFLGEKKLMGFFVQDTVNSMENPFPDGIFVFAPKLESILVGAMVSFKGKIDSAYGQIRIIEPESIIVIDSTYELTPLRLTLPFPTADYLKQFDAMLVEFAQELTVTSNFELGTHGRLTLSAEGRLLFPTSIADPNDKNTDGVTSDGTANIEEILAIKDDNEKNALILDDGSKIVNPVPIPWINNENGTIRCGSKIKGLRGIISCQWGRCCIHPCANVLIEYACRPAPPVFYSANCRIVLLNLQNYFTTPVTFWGTVRGASSEIERQRQKQKLVAAILTLQPDIVGLTEIQNNGDSALHDLVLALNSASGETMFASIDSAYLKGSDVIRCGLIYKPSQVSPQGRVEVFSDPAFSRPPIAQTFIHKESSAKFSVIVCHFKSRICEGTSGSDVESDYGQGCYNNRRKKQALAISALVDSIITACGDSDVIVIGDFNSYPQEDPIDILRSKGLNTFGNIDYSYCYEGLFGALDNALATPSLIAQTCGSAIWHCNADEPPFLDYTIGNKKIDLFSPTAWRCSDHDPLLIGLLLTEDDARSCNEEPACNWPIRLTIKSERRLTNIQLISDGDYKNKFFLNVYNFQGRFIASMTVNLSQNGTFSISADDLFKRKHSGNPIILKLQNESKITLMTRTLFLY